MDITTHETRVNETWCYQSKEYLDAHAAELLRRREERQRVVDTHPQCAALRDRLRVIEPRRMWLHERDTLQGLAMTILGQHPTDKESQIEWLIWINYQQTQQRLAAQYGECWPECRDEHRNSNGVCIHTGQPCAKHCLAQVIEYIGIINNPELKHER